jgi:hypothetical protein
MAAMDRHPFLVQWDSAATADHSINNHSKDKGSKPGDQAEQSSEAIENKGGALKTSKKPSHIPIDFQILYEDVKIVTPDDIQHAESRGKVKKKPHKINLKAAAEIDLAEKTDLLENAEALDRTYHTNNKRRIALLGEENFNNEESKFYIHDAKTAMLVITRFISLFRVFGLELTLHKTMDYDFVNAVCHASTLLFKRATFGKDLMAEFLESCNIRVLLPLLEVGQLSFYVVTMLSLIAETSQEFYSLLVGDSNCFQLVCNSIKQMKGDCPTADLMIKFLLNFAKPFPTRKLAIVANQSLELLMDASSVLPVRLAVCKWVAKNVFSEQTAVGEGGQTSQKKKEKIVTKGGSCSDSDTSTDSDDNSVDERSLLQINQCDITVCLVFNAIKILTDFRVHKAAILEAYTLLDNLLKFGETKVLNRMGKEMLPNLISLMRNHPSDDPNRHWRDIHTNPETAQEAAIRLLNDLLRHGGAKLADSNKVVFAILSSLTHVDEYTVQVEALNILQFILSDPNKWKVACMAIRLVLPVKLMERLEKLNRFAKRGSHKAETTVKPVASGDKSPDSKTKFKLTAKLWNRAAQMATTSVSAVDGSRITSVRASIRQFLTQDLDLEMIYIIRRNLVDFGWKPENLRPLTPPSRAAALLRTIRKFGTHGHGMITKRRKVGRMFDKGVRKKVGKKEEEEKFEVKTTQNTILLRLKLKESKQEKQKEMMDVLQNDSDPSGGKRANSPSADKHENDYLKKKRPKVHKTIFCPLAIPAVKVHPNSTETGLHDVSFIRRSNMSLDIQERNAQAAEGLGNAFSFSNSVAASIARDVLHREDQNINNRKAADTLMAAKFGAAHASELKPSDQQVLQDRVEQGMVLLMMQQRAKHKNKGGKFNKKHPGHFQSHSMHGVKMRSDNMLKLKQSDRSGPGGVPQKPTLTGKIAYPSPRSKALLRGYCRGNRVDSYFEAEKEQKRKEEESKFLGGSSTAGTERTPSEV